MTPDCVRKKKKRREEKKTLWKRSVVEVGRRPGGRTRQGTVGGVGQDGG